LLEKKKIKGTSNLYYNEIVTKLCSIRIQSLKLIIKAYIYIENINRIISNIL